MIVKTVQTFVVTYETDDLESFAEFLDAGEDVGQYEVDQEFLGEVVVHTGN